MKTRHQICSKLTFAASVLFAFAGTATAVDFSHSTGNLVYDDGDGNTLPYRLFLPEDYDPNNRYPLIVFFHGAGERGRDNRRQASGGGHMEYLYRNARFDERYKAFLLTPQCPSSDQWVNWPWAKGSYTQAEEPPESRPMHSALAILDQVIATYPVETDQVYVTGLSMGGFATWDALRRRPGLFAAAMPLSGGGNKEQGAAFSRTPIWAYHGSSDGIVPVQGADEMRDSIAAAGGAIEYTRTTSGHSGWSTFYSNRRFRNSMGQTVYDWLFAQTQKVRSEPFEITAIELTRNGDEAAAKLTWASRSMEKYVIQTSGDSIEWSDLPQRIEAAGPSASASVTIPPGTAKSFFRIREALPEVGAGLLPEEP